MWPDDIAENLAMLDQLGSPATYNHYPTGWAAAFSTPYRMFKRYLYAGGVCDPLLIHWPNGFDARGEVRNQYHHAVDIVPTILECCGVDFPDIVDGVAQVPQPGVSMKYSLRRRRADPQKQVQYCEMMGHRGIWADGWKATTLHGPIARHGEYDHDVWQLFHTDIDRAEAYDLAGEHPDKVEALKTLWMEEANKYDVLPLSDHGSPDIPPGYTYHGPVPPSGQYTYYRNTSPVPEASAAGTLNRSFKILAEVDFAADTQGVILAQGSRFGGHALFVKNYYVYQLPRHPTRTTASHRRPQLWPPYRRGRVHEAAGR
jgi:arylsulfatase